MIQATHSGARRFATALFALAACGFGLSAGAQQNTPVVPGEVLVGLRADQDTPAHWNRLSPWGVSAGHLAALHAHRLQLRPGVSIETALTQLRRRSDVLFAEPNHMLYAVDTPPVPNDPSYNLQYAPRLVQADLAWSLWKPSQQTIIAIVDTGVDSTHPDLTNKILRNGNVIVGYNALTGVSDPALDDFGHGTHCAGIAAAEVNNGIGVAGIAGWNGQIGSTNAADIKIMSVKVLDSHGSGTDASVADGIVWAADHGAQVISLSLGSGSDSTTLDNAVKHATDKGVIVVAAAGNNGSSNVFYPAGCPGAVSVAATDSGDTLASFSNYGSWVQVAAPGVNIYSTLPVNSGQFGHNYGYLSGTSMATPHVAGEAAFLLAQNPTLTLTQLKSALTTNVDPYKPYSGRMIAPNAGRINVYKALLAVSGGSPPPPTLTPVYQINCGGGAVAPFTADAYYNVKRSYSKAATITLTGLPHPAPQSVYLSQNYSAINRPLIYTFPNLTPGATYTVRLHFAELDNTTTGQRLFSVSLNGQSLFASLDLVAVTGGRFVGMERDYATTANASGQVVLTLTPIKSTAAINGIEILE